MFLVTGADGQLSGRVVDRMLSEVDGDQLILTSPVPERIAPERAERWRAAGATIRKADYSDPDGLARAYEGADAGFMVSAMTVGDVRQAQHRNSVDAFVRAGVGRIVYSSGYGAGEANDEQVVIIDHHATEVYIRESGLAWNVFRDNLYLENYLYAFAQMALDEGRWRTCAGDSPAYLVAKDDCAASAAALLLGRGEPNTAYDITGGEAVSVHQISDLVAERSGVEIVYDSMPEDVLYAYYDSLHIPRTATGDFSRSPYPWCSEDILTNEAAIRDGLLDNRSDDVEQLVGRPPLTVADLIEEAAASWTIRS